MLAYVCLHVLAFVCLHVLADVCLHVGVCVPAHVSVNGGGKGRDDGCRCRIDGHKRFCSHAYMHAGTSVGLHAPQVFFLTMLLVHSRDVQSLPPLVGGGTAQPCIPLSSGGSVSNGTHEPARLTI